MRVKYILYRTSFIRYRTRIYGARSLRTTARTLNTRKPCCRKETTQCYSIDNYNR